jgi:hypothetical protein
MSLGAGQSPTLQGFQSFVANVMGVPSSVMDPATSPVVQYAYDFARDWVYRGLQTVRGVPGVWSLYARAVYNLAADTLINWAQDEGNPPTAFKNDLPYWAWLRGQYGVNAFVAGVVQSTSDEGTSSSYVVPDAFKELTIANLGNLKTPYGRAYLGIVQSWGAVWGIS